MSTYTDLHNRVKESLTVDYHSRITPQVISALNPENEFWGKFKGSFSGDVQISSLSDSVIFDSDFIRGRQLSSVMDSPKLFLSVDEESGEDIIQDLTAYIAEHGSGGVSSVISGVTLLDSILAGCSISADGTVSSLIDYIKAHDGGELARAISAWLDGRFALSEGVLSAKDTALAVNALSVAFDRVCDLNEVPLSALLKDLADKDTVLDVCVRVNDIISLAGLAVEPLDFETCSCGDLFTAVRGIAGDEGIASFGEAVASLNAALRRLVAKNRSLESRLSFLMRRIDDIIVLVNRLSADLSREITAGDSAVLSEVRLSAVEFWKAAKATEERVDGLIQVSADHESRIGSLEIRSAATMMLSGGEFGGGVSFEKDKADLSVCFTDVIDFDTHALSDFLKPLAESVTVFGICVRINDMIRLSGKGIEPVQYDTTDIEDMFGTVKELTGVEPTDIGSVRIALNEALAVLTLGGAARTLEGRFGILSKRDDCIIEKVDALSAEIAKGSALAEVSAFLSGEIDKKADSSELTAYALSADVMSRETAAGRFDGVNGRIDGVLAKLKSVCNALSSLPANPAEFNLIENVAPALIALRSALSAFA